jgi:sugar lactone lactonase YvrE
MSLVVVVTAGSGLLTATPAHAAGETEWVSRYALARTDGAQAAAVSPDGSTVFVTGFSTGPDASLDYATVAYDAVTGTKKWVRRYNHRGDTDEAFALAVSPDGTTVFVTGTSGFNYYATVAYAANTGATRWVRLYDGGFGENNATAIDVSPDGSIVFVTGISNGSPSNADYATLAYDAATGASKWVRRYNGPGDDGDEANALAVSPDGATVFVTGSSQTNSSRASSEYASIAYAADTGATRWLRRSKNRGDGDFARAVAVSPDGKTVFVTGFSSFNYLTLAYEAGTGSTVWHRRYGGTCPCNDQANAVAVSPDGSTVFVTGRSTGPAHSLDYATVAYDSVTGTRKWVRRHNGPANGDDVARSLAVSPDGATVYVTGSIVVGGGVTTDYFTVAYDAATGAPRWHRRYNGPGGLDDWANSVAASPDGTSVFVTGRASGTDETADNYVTVAYAA